MSEYFDANSLFDSFTNTNTQQSIDVTQPNTTNEVIQVQGTRVPKTQQPVETVQSPVPMTQVQQPVETVQQPVQNSQPLSVSENTQENLNVLMNIKPYYTDDEWEQRKNIYWKECGKIYVDNTNLNSSDIVVAAGRIDALLTPIMIDNSNFQSNQLMYDLQLKVAKQMTYKYITEDYEKQGKKQPTINDKEALVTAKIYSDNNHEDNFNLFKLLEKYSVRANQSKCIVDILKDKKDMLITYSAALKLENATNNFTANVPTNNQVNQMRG